jgi:hypothetical protein
VSVLGCKPLYRVSHYNKITDGCRTEVICVLKGNLIICKELLYIFTFLGCASPYERGEKIKTNKKKGNLQKQGQNSSDYVKERQTFSQEKAL